MSGDLVSEFPAPGPLLGNAFADLRAAAAHERNDGQNSDAAVLPKPWDPSTCAPSIRAELWRWLDDVVKWLNHDHTWLPEHCVPSCWPAHPHLTWDLATLACTRLAAGQAVTPAPLEDWHRQALPAFFDRMHERLGGAPCQPGAHKASPATTRHAAHNSTESTTRRRQCFDGDTE